MHTPLAGSLGADMLELHKLPEHTLQTCHHATHRHMNTAAYSAETVEHLMQCAAPSGVVLCTATNTGNLYNNNI